MYRDREEKQGREIGKKDREEGQDIKQIRDKRHNRLSLTDV